MSKNVEAEKELYPPMCVWLKEYLEYRYPDYEVDAYDTHEIKLDDALQRNGYPLPPDSKIVGIPIEIDVLGVIQSRTDPCDIRLVFIEAKKTNLSIHALGQLLVYCRIADPIEAFLLSSKGMGGLNNIIVNKERTDIVTYGSYNEKTIHAAAWDVQGKHPIMETMTPGI